ncbi:hypothetical protein DFR49_2960 [Hephaestia caeni]|uniref:DUF2384 domain-containing protein n=1 Tax=Hephaestia caeni TaxID=645617 RepID=A0A397NQP8_9SPHN|nr:hypothetical protein [Hephaestia caeni]RIA37085.1 hypothetical protein DFR49_2960 [Hephaestia caeni]
MSGRFDDPGDMIDLAGRIMLTHRLAPELAMRALRIERSDAERMIVEGRLSRPLEPTVGERLRLFVNILTRLEHRLRHDSAAIRRAFETPLDALERRSPTDMLNGDAAALFAVRQAIDHIDTPKEKWWRVGH